MITRPHPTIDLTAEALRDARKHAGMTQLQLAVKAGVHVSTIAQAEIGKRLRPATQKLLARALGISMEEEHTKEGLSDNAA